MKQTLIVLCSVFLFLLLPSFNTTYLELNSASAVAPNVTHDYTNPITVDSFSGWFANLLSAIQGIVGWLAVIMIIVGGMVYITSGGSQTQTARGKAIVVTSLIGFAVAVAAPSLLKEIRDLSAAGAAGGTPALISGAKTIEDIVTDVMEFLLTIVGILAIISFVIGGIQYITSGGDQARAETGKKTIVYSIIAICVSGASLVILRQVIHLLS